MDFDRPLTGIWRIKMEANDVRDAVMRNTIKILEFYGNIDNYKENLACGMMSNINFDCGAQARKILPYLKDKLCQL